MVHILLPIRIIMGPLDSSVEVLGKSASFTQTPLQIQTTLKDRIQLQLMKGLVLTRGKL
jgi:hypothetical protein